MERMLILNASPRAPRSNSKVYAQMLAHGWGGPAAYREVLSPAAYLGNGNPEGLDHKSNHQAPAQAKAPPPGGFG